MFSSSEIKKDWQTLSEIGPRFVGTPNEIEAFNYILSRLEELNVNIEKHEFNYLGWTIKEPPKLSVSSPSFYEFPCEAFMYCSPTPKGGVKGKVEYLGFHQVIESFVWKKMAIVDDAGEVVAYISARLDGPAHPQPLDQASSPKPHFIIGECEFGFFESWLKRGLEVIVEGEINCELNPEATSNNIIASFGVDKTAPRILLCAHYDSVYGCPGADDNASGVTALLAIARHMASEQLDLPVDFLFFGAEEVDCMGSRAYVADRVSGNPDHNIKFLLNLDRVSDGHTINLWAGPEGFEEDINKVVKTFPHPRSIGRMFYFPPPRGADHVPFYYEEGVPVCMITFQDNNKWHLPKDKYCPEGVENITYVTELVWYLMEKFSHREFDWPTVRGLLDTDTPES